MDGLTSGRGVMGSLRLVAAVVLVAGVMSACGSGRPPPRLVDGSRGGPPPRLLARLGSGAISTRVTRVAAEAAPARWRGCLDGFSSELAIAGDEIVALERTGLSGQSLSVYALRRRFALACDRTEVRGEGGRRWCGSAHGELAGTFVRDPRLDIGCTSSDGLPVGFAWINPLPTAVWVVARNGRRREIYRVGEGLPVRITTRSVQTDDSSASFDVTEYDARGSELRHETVRTSVAG
jgi:hypothetical protein